MADPTEQQPKLLDWSQGTNNLTSRNRQPSGTARLLVNVDPMNGGILALRAGSERVLDAAGVRGVLSLGRKLLVAAGSELVEFDTLTMAQRVVHTITPAGGICGDVVNDRLYFCTANEALEYDGNIVRPWGVTDVTYQPPVAASTGGLQPGYYKVAVTYSDSWGREGGTDKSAIVTVTDGGISVGPIPVPADHTANVYVGSSSGSTLYLQTQAGDGDTVQITQLRDDTQQCTTEFMRAPRAGHIVRAINGVLAVANGKVVQLTAPMQYHLVDRLRGYLQYPAKVGAMLADVALYVSADKCYRVVNPETKDVEQATLFDYPAVPGTDVQLPDGRGAWTTRYGVAVTTPQGMEQVHQASYAADFGEAGASGVLDFNGNQLIITVMRGRKTTNPLAAKETRRS